MLSTPTASNIIWSIFEPERMEKALSVNHFIVPHMADQVDILQLAMGGCTQGDHHRLNFKRDGLIRSLR